MTAGRKQLGGRPRTVPLRGPRGSQPRNPPDRASTPPWPPCGPSRSSTPPPTRACSQPSAPLDEARGRSPRLVDALARAAAAAAGRAACLIGSRTIASRAGAFTDSDRQARRSRVGGCRRVDDAGALGDVARAGTFLTDGNELAVPSGACQIPRRGRRSFRRAAHALRRNGGAFAFYADQGNAEGKAAAGRRLAGNARAVGETRIPRPRGADRRQSGTRSCRRGIIQSAAITLNASGRDRRRRLVGPAIRAEAAGVRDQALSRA